MWKQLIQFCTDNNSYTGPKPTEVYFKERAERDAEISTQDDISQKEDEKLPPPIPSPPAPTSSTVPSSNIPYLQSASFWSTQQRITENNPKKISGPMLAPQAPPLFYQVINSDLVQLSYRLFNRQASHH
jgi:hypothetical protein